MLWKDSLKTMASHDWFATSQGGIVIQNGDISLDLKNIGSIMFIQHHNTAS
jgi:hypothetical protein